VDTVEEDRMRRGRGSRSTFLPASVPHCQPGRMAVLHLADLLILLTLKLRFPYEEPAWINRALGYLELIEEISVALACFVSIMLLPGALQSS